VSNDDLFTHIIKFDDFPHELKRFVELLKTDGAYRDRTREMIRQTEQTLVKLLRFALKAFDVLGSDWEYQYIHNSKNEETHGSNIRHFVTMETSLRKAATRLRDLVQQTSKSFLLELSKQAVARKASHSSSQEPISQASLLKGTSGSSRLHHEIVPQSLPWPKLVSSSDLCQNANSDSAARQGRSMDSTVHRPAQSLFPVRREGSTDPPIRREQSRDPPVRREEAINFPARQEERSNPPVRREEGSKSDAIQKTASKIQVREAEPSKSPLNNVVTNKPPIRQVTAINSCVNQRKNMMVRRQKTPDSPLPQGR
jgi:hypothetical protein